MSSPAPDSRRRALGAWAWLVALLVAGMAVVVVAVQTHGRAAAEARRAALRDLAAVAALKSAHVQGWRAERHADARLLTMPGSPLFEVEARPALAPNPAPGAAAGLARRLTQIRAMLGYEAVMLAGPDGRLLAGGGRLPAELDPAARELVRRSAHADGALFGVLVKDPDPGGSEGGQASVWLDVAAAYRDPAGHLLAVLLLRSAADADLFPLLRDWPSESASAESLLVARDGEQIVFLNPLRHVPDAPLSRRRPLASEEVVGAQAARGATGVVEGVDYRGVAVVADVRPIPGSDWFMVAKVDLKELDADAERRSQATLLMAGGAIVTVTLLLMVAAALQRRNAWRARFRAEQAERQALEEYRATMQGIGDAVLSTDAEGRVRYLNPVAEALTGWSVQDACGRHVQEVFRIVNEDTRAEVESPVAHVLRDGAIVGLANHTLLIARDGSERPIADSGAPIRSDDGRLAGVVLVFRDQTDERRALQALQASEERLRRLFEGSADALLLLDMDAHRFTDCNLAAVTMLGLRDKAEVLGSHPAELSPPRQDDGRDSGEKAAEMIETARREGFHRFEWTHCSRARTPFTVDVLLTPFTEGPPALAVATWRDLTAVKRAERERAATAAELAERNDELARFNRAAVDRELRMVELKREADALRARLGEPPRHAGQDPAGDGGPP